MSQGRVLVVDDDPLVRLLVCEMLSAEGYDVDAARDGQEGIERLTADTDLVLLDWQMPRLGGKGLADAMRFRGLKIPIVLLTGIPDAAEAAREIGALAYLVKPFSLDRLRETVAQLIDTASREGREARAS